MVLDWGEFSAKGFPDSRASASCSWAEEESSPEARRLRAASTFLLNFIPDWFEKSRINFEAAAESV